MDIISHVENLRDRVKARGLYRQTAEQAGLNYHWLQKFAVGIIPNPTVGQVAKLENFFKGLSE